MADNIDELLGKLEEAVELRMLSSTKGKRTNEDMCAKVAKEILSDLEAMAETIEVAHYKDDIVSNRVVIPLEAVRKYFNVEEK